MAGPWAQTPLSPVLHSGGSTKAGEAFSAGIRLQWLDLLVQPLTYRINFAAALRKAPVPSRRGHDSC